MKLSIIVLLVISSALLYGYQQEFLNLTSVSELQDKESEFTISHRFLGSVEDEPLDTFFGMDIGANVGIAYRYSVYQLFEAKAEYSSGKKEYSVGVSRQILLFEDYIKGQINVDYFSFKEVSIEDRRNNFYYQIALQSTPIFDRIMLNLNAGFDGYYERLTSGIGLGVKVLDNLTILTEYFPTLDRDSADERIAKYLGEDDSFAIGVKLDTYGHQFIFQLSNSDALNSRRASLGTNDGSDLKFGFKLQRRFQ